MNDQMIFGLRPIIEAIDAGREINKILFKKGLESENSKELKDLIQKHQIPSQIVPVEKLNRITRKNHQGVIAFISPVDYQQIENLIPEIFESGKDPFIVICDGITDVRNIGAIARTAECAGAQVIIFPSKGTAMISAEAVKSSAGALEHISVCRTENLHKTIKFLKNSGLRIIAASEKANADYDKVDLKGPVALLLGAEDTGISSECLRLADEIVKIPVYGQISSLNVSAAAAVLLYEIVRRNH